MAELALGEPSGLVSDLAGPKIYTMAELVSSYLSAASKRRSLGPVHMPGRQAARAFRAGANLAPHRRRDRIRRIAAVECAFDYDAARHACHVTRFPVIRRQLCADLRRCGHGLHGGRGRAQAGHGRCEQTVRFAVNVGP